MKPNPLCPDCGQSLSRLYADSILAIVVAECSCGYNWEGNK